MWSCTCQSPPICDLTDAFLAPKAQQSINSKAFSSTQSNLHKSLKQWGWTQIRIQHQRLPQDSPLIHLQPNRLKQQIRDLFDPDFVRRAKGADDAVYRGRTAESGASQSERAEPKQSWEVCRCTTDTSQEASIFRETRGWAEALHAVAVAVTRTLDLPCNVLLQEHPCHCCSNSRNDEMMKHKTRCNVDLMRVFYYDAVQLQSQESVSLGSNEHTDWGSFTVVWQDDIGGLQTYCHEHKRWVDVAPSRLDDSYLYFVVHLSDVTSLAMGHAAQSTELSSSLKSGGVGGAVCWPSPRHRVVSPTDMPRASLVYFAYPPPGVSLQDMEAGLKMWYHSLSTARRVLVPYEEYFVLKDQSQENLATATSPRRVYEETRTLPLDGVIRQKWNQVQRS